MSPNPAPASGLPDAPDLGCLDAALRAFRRAIDPDGLLGVPRPAARPRAVARDPLSAYRAARRDHARALLAEDPDAGCLRLPIAPRLTVFDDAWALEGWNAEASTLARLAVDRAAGDDLAPGTTRVTPDDLGRWRAGRPGSIIELQSRPMPPDDPPPGWARGLAAVLGALALPARRVPIDRGGLLGLLGAVGRGGLGRAVVVRWDAGRPAEAEVGGRSVALHAREGVAGPSGSVRVATGPALAALGDLLSRVEGAELLIDPTGAVATWAVRLAGGVRLVLARAAWTLDGRWGTLRVDAAAPPVEAGRFLLNQVVVSFRDRPSQSRREVVDRTRGNAPAVLAALHRLAASGLILPEPEADRLRWRPDPGPGLDAPMPDDPEPAEVAAARAIARTESVRVGRDEVLPEGRGRRVEGLILDRPARVELDLDGWLRRGSCTCSHHEAGRLARGPCRHLLALQARVVDGLGPTPGPADLAAWHAAFGGAT